MASSVCLGFVGTSAVVSCARLPCTEACVAAVRVLHQVACNLESKGGHPSDAKTRNHSQRIIQPLCLTATGKRGVAHQLQTPTGVY